MKALKINFIFSFVIIVLISGCANQHIIPQNTRVFRLSVVQKNVNEKQLPTFNYASSQDGKVQVHAFANNNYWYYQYIYQGLAKFNVEYIAKDKTVYYYKLGKNNNINRFIINSYQNSNLEYQLNIDWQYNNDVTTLTFSTTLYE